MIKKKKKKDAITTILFLINKQTTIMHKLNYYDLKMQKSKPTNEKLPALLLIEIICRQGRHGCHCTHSIIIEFSLNIIISTSHKHTYSHSKNYVLTANTILLTHVYLKNKKILK